MAYGATEAQALELEFDNGFIIDEDEIDWVNEDLVGTTFAQPGCGFDVTVDTVEWLINPNVVRINVFEEATGSCEQQLLKWVFLWWRTVRRASNTNFDRLRKLRLKLAAA